MHADMVYDTKYLGNLLAANLFNCGAYRKVRITAIDKPIFVKFGDATVVASAADDNELISPGDAREYVTGPAQTHVSVIEQAASAKATIALVG